AYDILKYLFKKHIGVGEDPILEMFMESVRNATDNFFKNYGDTYGTVSSSFLSNEHNWDVIFSSIYYGATEIDENKFASNGFGISRRDALVGAKHFVHMLNVELRKNRALDQILTEKKHIIDTAK